MSVLADTPVWSAAFRRSDGRTDVLRAEMETLVSNGQVAIIGPIRQELLSGINDRARFEKVRDGLRHFPDIAILTEDYENAAHYYNVCRAKGIQGSMTDFLTCAVAVRKKLPIFTTDGDFEHYRKYLPIVLHGPAKS
jgi:predicted nucleic acid-binding protein